MFNILNEISALENLCTSVPAEAVIIAILNIPVTPQFINREVESFKQTVFLSEQ